MSIAIIIECDITKHYFMLAILSKFLHVVSGALKVITRFYCKVRSKLEASHQKSEVVA